MEPLHLPGRRIVLRDWRITDLGQYAAWLQPGQRWQDLDAPYYSKPSEGEIARSIAHLRSSVEAGEVEDPRTNLAIAENTLASTLLGRVSWYWQSQETNWLSVGIVIYDPEAWGQGIGYEALGLWSDYLLSAMPALARLDLRTWSGNPGMMRLAQKLGYRQEACFRKARIVQGQYYDGLGYGILREEWYTRYQKGFAASL